MQAHIQSWHSLDERLQSYRLEQCSGATGKGSDYGKNGRATSEGAEVGVSGGRKLKRLGSMAGGGDEYARHGDGGGGKMSSYSACCYKRGQEWRDYDGK